MFEARFQTFENATERAASPARVAALRTELKRRKLDGFIVPRADRHQGEYVPASDARLAWLTGFTGSAGAAIVLADRAVIFVDGRYLLQVRDQVDTNVFAVEHLVDNPPEKWLETNLAAGARFAYDPWLHSADHAERLSKAAAAAGATLVPVETNPLDAVWPDRPLPPLGPVTVRELAFDGDLKALGTSKAAVRVDSSTGADAISRLIGDAGGEVMRGADPITLMKSVKNAAEITGTHAAHLRDGAAVANFLAWFDREAPGEKLTEIDAVAALESFRRDTGLLKEVSFPTISGAGPNGAIVHYRVTHATNRAVSPGELFLVDSGAQYQDGTTDITRTIAVGTPTADMRERFTRVLKGHIAIARAVFPDGTTGAQLDSFARQFLWSAGIDFDHGTGPGAGR